jgi:hypothetical protein
MAAFEKTSEAVQTSEVWVSKAQPSGALAGRVLPAPLKKSAW